MSMPLRKAELTQEDEVNVGRSRLYALLGLGLSYPGEALEETQDELWELTWALYPELLTTDELTRVTAKGLEPEYIAMFDGVDRRRHVKPYEALWYEGDRGKRQWEVKQFYQFFGLSLESDKNEMPDKVATELEFMHVLAYRSVLAKGASRGGALKRDPNEYQHYRAAQRDFLDRHLAKWLPQFCERVVEVTQEPYYARLAKVVSRFVQDDLEWLSANA